MKMINKYTLLWLIPLLLVMITAGCDDRVSVVAPPIVTTPTVSSTNPVDLAPGVAFNSKLTATFSETMDSLTITTATFTLMQGTSFVAGTVSYTGKTALFSPSSDLAPGTQYTATITTGAKNLKGSSLANNFVWSFTTGAAAVIAPPTVSSTVPLPNAVNVAFTIKPTATFSEPMDPLTITTATFTLMQGTSFVSGTVSYTGQTAMFTPTSDLQPSTKYTATITTGAKNLKGISLAANYAWSFTTAASGVTYTVALSSSPSAGGTTSGAGTFATGSSVTVTATPATGYSFVNWTEAGIAVSTSAGYNFNISSNRTLVANFALPAAQYTIVLTSNPSIGGTTSGGGTFNTGTSDTVKAIANTGYAFVNWTENGLVVSANANYDFSVIQNRTLVANFALNTGKYTVTLSSNPLAGGTTSGGGSFNSGASVNVTATANTGYTFTNWTENFIEVSTIANYSFTLTGNRTLVANFTQSSVGPAPVNLGSAGDFAVLAGSGISSTGLTNIFGDAGAFPTATINGFPPGVVVGTLYMSADPIVGTAKNDLTTAYNDAQGRSLNAISLPGQLGGLTLAPGLYVNSTSTGISGTGPNGILTLDAGGNSNAVWIFKMGSTLVTDAGTSIVLAGGAQWKNIYWSVGTSATLGTNSVFYGNILADQAITLTTGATLYGRALTRIAAVTLDAAVVDKR